MSSVLTWVRAHPIGAFIVWFFPVAWAIVFIPFVVPRVFGLELPLEVFLGSASIIGGVLPVVVITRLVDGPAGLVALRQRLLQTRASVGWYALTLLAVPLLCLVLAMIIYGPPSVTPSTLVSAIVNGLIVQSVLGFIVVNVWEEMAWMGFVQARLQVQRGVILAAVCTAALFTLQHIPLFVANGLVNPAGLVVLLAFFAISIPFRALVGWQYNRTGSLFLVGLLHAVGDATVSGGFAAGFLPRLYPNSDVGFFHMAALALMGLVVIAATRGKLGLSAAPTPHAAPELATAGSGA